MTCTTNGPCLVVGCKHTPSDRMGAMFTSEGECVFICGPCLKMLKTGKVEHGTTFIHNLANMYNSVQQDVHRLSMQYTSYTNMQEVKQYEK